MPGGGLLEDTLPQRHRTKGGAGVRLSISRPVQRTVEAVAGEMMSSGCVLVLDVATAKVRASVSLPAFDPNHVAASLGQPDSPWSTVRCRHMQWGLCSSRW